MTTQLILLSDAYCVAAGVTRGSVAGRIFNDGKRLDAIATGSDLNTRSFEKAMRWFDENWPDGIAWPTGVARPDPLPAGQGEAA